MNCDSNELLPQSMLLLALLPLLQMDRVRSLIVAFFTRNAPTPPVKCTILGKVLEGVFLVYAPTRARCSYWAQHELRRLLTQLHAMSKTFVCKSYGF